MHNLTMFDHADAETAFSVSDADPDTVRTVKTWLTAFHSCCGCHGYHWHPFPVPQVLLSMRLSYGMRMR